MSLQHATRPLSQPDYWLPGAALALLALGWVMVSSASITIAEREIGQPFYYLWHQSAFIGVGLLFAILVWRLPLAYWERFGVLWLTLVIVLLALVVVPGIGREVKGGMRWLALGPFNLQVSELAKLFVVVYLAGYIVHYSEELRASTRGFLKPLLVLTLIEVLLLKEPDFGAAVVVLATALGMLFLGGARLRQFSFLFALAALALAALAVSSPYRLARLTTFLNPWADPFNSGFQLTQALIAFGRGAWFGVGLGSSIQKLFYLPEAHTDFLFAVLAEELGLIGALAVIALYAVLVWRAFVIARRAAQTGRHFASHLAQGIGIWIALQTFINLGVNMGLLPTKGLTLPFMSYGGSSMVVSCIALALLLRIDYELRMPERRRVRRPV